MLVAKSEQDGSSALYDLEYRASEDDAWYSVYVVFDAQAQKLTVKYLCSPEVYEAVFHAREFETEAEVDEMELRFRPISQQLQDHECGKLEIGTTVCAAHGTGDDDLRFYDAIVDAVNRQPHSFTGGEEECLCTFVLFWQHGRGHGTLTSANIGSICTLECGYQIDPRISAFLTLAKEKINSSKNISVSDSLGSASTGPSSLKKRENVVEVENSMMRKSLMWKSEDSARNQDEDIGPELCNIDGLARAEVQHFILINNIEDDLTPSSIKKFIFEQTTIMSQPLVFPRLPSDPFARGAIVVDCQQKVQTIYKFLDNPNHLIVSSRGRPWVITERAFAGTFTTTWKLIPADQVKLNENIRTDEELEIVLSGTKSYKRAKQLRDLFVEYFDHESIICKKLALEEKKIWRSFQPA